MTNEPNVQPNVQLVKMSDVYLNHDFNCRETFCPQDVATLSESIRDIGLLQPIIVQPIKRDGKKWQIITGHRRFMACEMLGWTEIPAKISEPLSHEEAAIQNLSENIERRDLTILEEARRIEALFKGQAIRSIARKLGRETKWVSRRTKLIKAPIEVQKAADAGRIAEHRLDKVLSFDDPKDQVRVLNTFLKQTETLGNTGGIKSRFESNRARRINKDKYAPPKKKDFIEIVTLMLDATIIGIGPRAIAYAAGWISKEDILEDIMKLREQNNPTLVIPPNDKGYTPSSTE